MQQLYTHWGLWSQVHFAAETSIEIFESENKHDRLQSSNDLSTSCQARLLLFSAQISKLNSQSLNSERKEAELTLFSQVHPPPTPATFLS